MTDAQPDEGSSKDEQIGFHKGALTTLAKERQELAKLLNIVEQLMQMHVKALQEMGVDLTKQSPSQGDQDSTSKKMDDLLG